MQAEWEIDQVWKPKHTDGILEEKHQKVTARVMVKGKGETLEDRWSFLLRLMVAKQQ